MPEPTATRSDPATAPESTTTRARVEHLLGRRLRFTLRSDANGERDERVVTGTFQCLDRHRNFILRDASELRIFKVGAGIQKRRRALGAALVPGRHLTKVEALRGDLDEVQTIEDGPFRGAVDLSLSGVGIS